MHTPYGNLITLLAVILLLALFLAWMVWTNLSPMASRVEIASEKLPQAFSGFRIAQVSDLHNARFGEGNRKLLALLSEHKPDMIAVTGDFIDATFPDGRHTDLEGALAFAEEAVKIAPVYFVTGNHEAALAQYPQLKAGLEALGVTVLEDGAVPIRRGEDRITLLGLQDPSFARKNGQTGSGAPPMTEARLRALTEGAEGYTVLLSHRPELFERYVSCGVDLVLSGHAHGGQFRLPLIGGLYAPNQGFFPRYDGGLYADGSTQMVVSRGLGNSLIPIRLNNRPELVIIELKSSEIRN